MAEQKHINKMKAAKELKNLLNRTSRDRVKRKGDKQKTSFAPSTIGYGHGQCSRYWFYAFKGAEFDERFSAKSARNMEFGRNRHEYFEQLLDEAGIIENVEDIEKEIVISDPPIRGFIDAIIKFWDMRWPVEFKTTRDNSFGLKKQQMVPPAHHLLQILIYMRVRKLDYGFVIYENKNDQDYLIIPVHMNNTYNKYIDTVFDWMRKVYANVTDEDFTEPPKRKFSESSWACKGCPVSKTCWSDVEGEVDLGRLPVLK